MTKKIYHLMLAALVATTGLGCSSLLYYPSEKIYVPKAKLNPSPEEHSFTLSDGTKINGWYFQARGGKPRAVIIFFHGNGQNRSSHFRSLHWVTKNGYDLAIFDYPGYGTSDGKPSPESTVRMGRKALQYVRKLKPDLPLVVYGQSLGGVVAMRSVWEERERFKPKLLVVDSSFLSYQEAARETLEKSFLTWLFQPLAYVLFSDRWAAEGKLSSLEGVPIVVVHSKQDQIIPFELGEQVFEQANPPKDFWVMKSGGHIQTYMGEEGAEMRERLLKALPQ